MFIPQTSPHLFGIRCCVSILFPSEKLFMCLWWFWVFNFLVSFFSRRSTTVHAWNRNNSIVIYALNLCCCSFAIGMNPIFFSFSFYVGQMCCMSCAIFNVHFAYTHCAMCNVHWIKSFGSAQTDRKKNEMNKTKKNIPNRIMSLCSHILCAVRFDNNNTENIMCLAKYQSVCGYWLEFFRLDSVFPVSMLKGELSRCNQ